jgi:hypothetical protein
MTTLSLENTGYRIPAAKAPTRFNKHLFYDKAQGIRPGVRLKCQRICISNHPPPCPTNAIRALIVLLNRAGLEMRPKWGCCRRPRSLQLTSTDPVLIYKSKTIR